MRYCLFAILFAVGILTIQAETAIQTQVSTNQVALNEPFELEITVTVDNSSRAPEIIPPKFPNDFPFTVLQQSRPQVQHFKNGFLTSSGMKFVQSFIVKTKYQLRAKTEGVHQIPGLEFTVNGKRHLTDPVSITVSKEAPSDVSRLSFTAKFSTSQVTVGDRLTLSYDILVPQNLRIGHLDPKIQQSLDALAPYFKRLADNNWQEGSRRLNGKDCLTFHLELQLIAKQEGTFTLPPSTLFYQVPAQRHSRNSYDPFGMLNEEIFSFGLFESYRTESIDCDAATVEILPLPEEGKPAGFTGIIGQLSTTAIPSATTATVGEPILVDFVFKGAYNLSEIKLPDLSQTPELTQHFKIAGDDPVIERNGQATLQRTLRATHPGDLTIPAFHFSYFDPESREYRTASTEPIPLKVTAARQITLEDAQGNVATPATITATSANTGASPTPKRTLGLEPDFPPEEFGGHHLVQAAPFKRFIVPLTCIAIPPALWLFLTLTSWFFRMRNATGTTRAIHGAKGVLLRTVDKLNANDPQAATKFATALQVFFTTRFQLPPGVVTFADAESAALRDGFRPEQIAPFQELFVQCEAVQYAGGAFHLEELRNRLRNALKEF